MSALCLLHTGVAAKRCIANARSSVAQMINVAPQGRHSNLSFVIEYNGFLSSCNLCHSKADVTIHDVTLWPIQLVTEREASQFTVTQNSRVWHLLFEWCCTMMKNLCTLTFLIAVQTDTSDRVNVNWFSFKLLRYCVHIRWNRGELASSPGHSQLFNVARRKMGACNIEKLGGAWGRG